MLGDEVVTDTNQIDDGNDGGKRCISINLPRKNLLFSKSCGHFILMWMTAETGDTLLFICILAAKSLSVTDVKGFD